MHPLFITGLVFAGITALVMPYYCKITFKGKDQTTLSVKMFLSTLFLLTAILSLFSFESHRPYMIVMLFAFIVDYVGDFLLGKSDRMRMFVAGSCCFAAGHILFIVAFSMVAKAQFSKIGWFNGTEIGVFLAIVSVVLLIALIKNPPFHKLFIPMFAYYFVVALMIAKAFGVALRMFPVAPALVMLPIGAVCFLCSDYMLGMLRFKMHEKTVVFKSVCTASYFVAQMLMALSMYTLIRF